MIALARTKGRFTLDGNAEWKGQLWSDLKEILHKSMPQGVRQIVSVVTFSFTPTLAGLALDPEAAASYAMPHKIFLSAWSIVGVLYIMYWGKMLAASQTTDNRHQRMRSLRRRLSLKGTIAAAGIGFAVLTLGRPMSEIVGGKCSGGPPSSYSPCVPWP